MVLTALFFVPAAASAAQRDMVSSCFETLKLSAPKTVVKHELFVVIDQTTPIDEAQQKSLITSVMMNLAPETAVTILTFSSFTGDHYANEIFSGMLDRRLKDSERDNTPGNALRDYDACINQQVALMHDKIDEAMRNGYGKPSETIARSDIIATLKDISGSLVARSPAKQKDVLLISDMLENSQISSFYDKGNLRLIDPVAEMQKAAGSLGDFGGAKIYVAGVGAVANGKKAADADKDPKPTEALEAFWRDYFSKSNAELAVFGKPSIRGQF